MPALPSLVPEALLLAGPRTHACTEPWWCSVLSLSTLIHTCHTVESVLGKLWFDARSKTLPSTSAPLVAEFRVRQHGTQHRHMFLCLGRHNRCHVVSVMWCAADTRLPCTCVTTRWPLCFHAKTLCERLWWHTCACCCWPTRRCAYQLPEQHGIM